MLLDHPPAPAERAAVVLGPVRRWARPALAAAPWLVTLAVLVMALRATHTAAASIAGYAGYWALALVLPGVLTHRALRGSRGNLPEDVAYGAATGLLLELIAWAAAAATGWQPLLRCWPALVVVVFLAAPALRRHWRIADPKPLPLRWSWAMAATLVLLIGWSAAGWSRTPLPPVTTNYYQDLLYHLSLIQELTRGMPFRLPQLAGEPLRYTYLSDAHLASASMITGVAPAVVLLRLWLVPVAAVAAVISAGLARDLTGRWWAGPFAAAVAFVGLPVTVGAPIGAMGGGPVSYVSPSQTYAMPFVLLLVGLVAELARGRALGAGWALAPALALACAGSKASALPPVLAGTVVAALVAAVHRWRPLVGPPPARGTTWRLLAAVGTQLAMMALGFRLFAGGGAGTLAVQAMSVLRWMPPYQSTFGVDEPIERGGLIPPGLEHADGAAWLFVSGILGWWLVLQSPRLVGLLGGATEALRADPAAWLLGGVLLAGTAATWLLYHPSASQAYFFVGVAPFGALLSVWLLARAPVRGRALVAALGVGAAAQWLWPAAAPPAPVAAPAAGPATDLIDDWGSVLWSSVGRVALLAAVGVLLTVALDRRRPAPPPAGSRPRWAAVAAAGVTATLLGASLAAGAEPTVVRAFTGVPPATPLPSRQLVTAAEMRAALWLDAHAGAGDVIATNVHCQPVSTFPGCDARAFWVTGLGGRRAVVESWGYSDKTVAAHGVNERSYPLQPAPDRRAFVLNERVFKVPAAADLAQLRRRYGVRWLFADTRAGAVSPDLAALAPVRYTAGSVTIHELP